MSEEKDNNNSNSPNEEEIKKKKLLLKKLKSKPRLKLLKLNLLLNVLDAISAA